MLRRALGAAAVFLLLGITARVGLGAGFPLPADQPFAVPNQSPLALSLVPFTPQGAALEPAGTSRLRLTTAYSSVFVRQGSRSTGLDLDMELGYVSLGYAYTPLPRLRLGLELPAAFYWGGFLDSFIQGYHRTLGLPNGGREEVANDQVRYDLTSKGKHIVSQDGSTQAVGDLRLQGAWLLWVGGGPAVSLLGQLSLPTGDPDKGLGAGGAIPALGLAADLPLGRFRLNANAMYFYLGTTDLLDPLEPGDVWAGSLSLGWAWTPALTLRAQVNAATSLVQDTGVEGLDNAMGQLLLGVQWVPAQGQLVSLALGEDLISYTSPDFTLSLSWGWSF